MLDFLYDLGCTFTLFVLVVFMEGVIATRKNAKWTGLILSAVLLITSVFVGAYMHDLGAFLFLLIPVVLCLAAYFFSRHQVKKRQNYAYHQGTNERLMRRKKGSLSAPFFVGKIL